MLLLNFIILFMHLHIYIYIYFLYFSSTHFKKWGWYCSWGKRPHFKNRHHMEPSPKHPKDHHQNHHKEQLIINEHVQPKLNEISIQSVGWGFEDMPTTTEAGVFSLFSFWLVIKICAFCCKPCVEMRPPAKFV